MTTSDSLYAVTSRAGPAADADLLVTATVHDGLLSGFVVDPVDRSRRFVLELLVDGVAVALTRADRFDLRMPEAGQAPKDYGFAFDLQRLPPARYATLEIRIANTDTIVARIDAPYANAIGHAFPGAVRWSGDLRFEGWLRDGVDGAPAVVAILDDAVVASADLHGARLAEDSELSRAYPAFDIHLPPRFADGRVRHLVVRDEAGRELGGSPVRFVAFADGLEDFLRRYGEVDAEEIHGRLRDRMFPRSAPFEALETWRARYGTTAPHRDGARAALLLLGEVDIDRTLSSLGPDEDLTIGVLPSGEDDGRFDPEDLAEALDHSPDATVLVVARSGTDFASGAVAGLAGALSSTWDGALAYCDVLLSGTTPQPLAFAAFDYERLLEQGYATWCFAITVDLARSGIAAGVDSLAALFFHGLEHAPAATAPLHLPGFLATVPPPPLPASTIVLKAAVMAHLSRAGRRADVRAVAAGRLLPALRVQRMVSAEAVGVVVTTRDEADRLRACIGRLAEQDTRHRLEIVVVDRGSRRPDQLRLLQDLGKRFRIVRLPGIGSAAQAFNRGAAELPTRLLLFLDASVEVQPDLVDEMVARCANDDVAACGATIVDRSGLVQSMGLVLGYPFGARAACRGNGVADPGFADMALVAQRRSALAAQCLLIKKADLAAVDGFDEVSFGRYMHAADLGLKLAARGRHLVVTPFARVLASQPDPLAIDDDANTLEAAGLRRERDLLRQRWGAQLDVDRFYSPLLALNGDLFSALACPPRAAEELRSDAAATHHERSAR